MAIRIKARAGESTEGLMRRFKKLCEKEGLTKDVKRKAFFEKPSERRRRAMRKRVKRAQIATLMAKGLLKKLPGPQGGPGGPGGPGMGGPGM